MKKLVKLFLGSKNRSTKNKKRLLVLSSFMSLMTALAELPLIAIVLLVIVFVVVMGVIVGLFLWWTHHFQPRHYDDPDAASYTQGYLRYDYYGADHQYWNSDQIGFDSLYNPLRSMMLMQPDGLVVQYGPNIDDPGVINRGAFVLFTNNLPLPMSSHATENGIVVNVNGVTFTESVDLSNTNNADSGYVAVTNDFTSGEMTVSGFTNLAFPPTNAVLYRSTNLISWVPVATNAYTGVLDQMIDTDTNYFPQRFYRVGLW